MKNCIVWFDEYNNDIDEKRFQSLKSAYDGMGHEKGKMSRDSRTEITKVNSASVISSQYLPIRDSNALLTRAITLIFEKQKYNKEAIDNYDVLKKLELAGISSIIGEILKFRNDIDVAYGMTFSGIMEQLKEEMISENCAFDERLLRNFVTILTPVKIILNTTDPLHFPFSYIELYDLSKKMISELSIQINSSDTVANFWHLVEYMLDLNPPLIREGDDFKIEKCASKLKLTDKHNTERDFPFDKKPEDLLFIRFTKIYPLYMEAHRRQYGKNGVDIISIQHFFKHHPAFLGTSKSTRFETSNTSAFVFKYEALKINLVRMVPDDKKQESNPDKTFEPGDKNNDFQIKKSDEPLPF